MNKIHALSGMILLALLVCTQSACAQAKPQNWTAEELEQPADLAAVLKSGKNIPVIINVGPGAIIPHSMDAGMGSTKEGEEKLSGILDSLDKKDKVVIYCGCCPFDHCPNIRPAIDLLKAKGFSNFFLLNLPHNINTDWITKGYPVVNK